MNKVSGNKFPPYSFEYYAEELHNKLQILNIDESEATKSKEYLKDILGEDNLTLHNIRALKTAYSALLPPKFESVSTEISTYYHIISAIMLVLTFVNVYFASENSSKITLDIAICIVLFSVLFLILVMALELKEEKRLESKAQKQRYLYEILCYLEADLKEENKDSSKTPN